MERKSKLNNIGLCFVENNKSIQENLVDLGLSKNQIKKFHLEKAFLQSVVKKKEYQVPIDLINFLKINPIYEGPIVEVLYEDDLVLVLNKPAKVYSHPQRYDESDNLLSFIRQNYEDQILTINEQNYDRGLLYRLDFETSGVMIYIKNFDLLKELRDQFHTLVKIKEYEAIVSGEFKGEKNLIQYFVSSGKNGEKMKVFDQEVKDSQKAQMIVSALSYDEKLDQSLVKILLQTGVRHQIRAGLSALGFPILGDEFYGGKSSERVYLHAKRYCVETKNLKWDFRKESQF